MKIIITESQHRTLMEGVNFEEVYQKTYKPIFNQVCMRYAKGDSDLAKDFCQLGFMKVFQNLHKYSGEGNLEGWVRRVVVNEVINQFRKRGLETTTNVDIPSMNLEVEPEEKDFLGGRISKEVLKKAIDKLPEGYRTILLLYYFAGMRHNKIAEVLGIDPGTSRSQISKAKTSLKKSLEKYL